MTQIKPKVTVMDAKLIRKLMPETRTLAFAYNWENERYPYPKTQRRPSA